MSSFSLPTLNHRISYPSHPHSCHPTHMYLVVRDACTGVLQCRGINSANARVALTNSFVVSSHPITSHHIHLPSFNHPFYMLLTSPPLPSPFTLPCCHSHSHPPSPLPSFPLSSGIMGYTSGWLSISSSTLSGRRQASTLLLSSAQ